MWRSSKTKEELFRALLNEKQLILFDTETTGLNSEKNRIIQIAAIKYFIEDFELIEGEVYNMYIRQPYPLPQKIIEITGITDAILEDYEFEDDIVDDIYNFMSSVNVVCGHNIKGFDMKFINNLFARYGKSVNYEFVLDTLDMARDICEKKESKKLGDIANAYGLNTGFSFHNALDDVKANGRVLKFFIEKYKELEAQQTETLTLPKKVPVPYQLSYWKGFRGNSRVYVETNLGGFYYDIYHKAWEVNNRNNEYSVEIFDMNALRDACFKLAKCEDECAMAKIVAKEGKIK
jgi:DNA polymerase III epsilon subunit family exonuclease